jgi:hypothetical protein
MMTIVLAAIGLAVLGLCYCVEVVNDQRVLLLDVLAASGTDAKG